MNDRSRTARPTGSGTCSAERKRAFHLFAQDDPRIVSELLVELAVADVDGIDAGGPALEEAIREAAGRGTRVEADEPGGVDAEGVELRRA